MVEYLTTGIEAWDDLFGGLAARELVVLHGTDARLCQAIAMKVTAGLRKAWVAPSRVHWRHVGSDWTPAYDHRLASWPGLEGVRCTRSTPGVTVPDVVQRVREWVDGAGQAPGLSVVVLDGAEDVKRTRDRGAHLKKLAGELACPLLVVERLATLPRRRGLRDLKTLVGAADFIVVASDADLGPLLMPMVQLDVRKARGGALPGRMLLMPRPELPS